MKAVAVPHITDLIGDTDAIADCVLAKVRSRIGTLVHHTYARPDFG